MAKDDEVCRDAKGLGLPLRRPEPGEVLRARPVKGPIDYVAWSREVIARYPKILARLAEYERACRDRRGKR